MPPIQQQQSQQRFDVAHRAGQALVSESLRMPSADPIGMNKIKKGSTVTNKQDHPDREVRTLTGLSRALRALAKELDRKKKQGTANGHSDGKNGKNAK